MMHRCAVASIGIENLFDPKKREGNECALSMLYIHGINSKLVDKGIKSKMSKMIKKKDEHTIRMDDIKLTNAIGN